MIDLTPCLRLYGRYRRGVLAQEDAVAAQERTLLSLVRRAAATRFGRDHDFARIASVADFQARVPLRAYDAFWRDYWQAAFPRLTNCTWPGTIPYLALSSGTTSGTTKYIPCSEAMVRANTRAGLDLLVHHLAARPRSRVLGGKSFLLGGSTDLKAESPGISSGDLSGIAAARVPWWAKHLVFPPLDIALMTDWEAKIAAVAELAPKADIRCLSGTPSWLLILFERLVAVTGQSGAAGVFPRLELLVHGGVSFAPYRQRFEAWLEGTPAELREVYAASEGFVALQDQSPADGLRLVVDNGLFFELVPVEELQAPSPTRHWLANAETGINYALAVSSCAGLWAYLVGDTVRLLSRAPPRLVITGRTAYALSAFGEHLIGEEIDEAVTLAAAAIGAAVTDYAVGALYPGPDTVLGCHLYVVELAASVDEGAHRTFTETIDRQLLANNDDYRAHRAGGFGMGPPRLLMVAPGGFARWMKHRGQLGGQHKVPRVINDPALFADLRRFLDQGS